MRRLLLIAALAVPLVVVAPAAAVEPTTETVTLHRTFNPAVSCPGFAVIGEFDVTREITTFYDEDGTPVMRIIRGYYTGTLTNAVTGYSLTGGGVRIFHFDLVTGEEFSTGSNFFNKLPEGGVSIPGAGRFLFDAQGRVLEHSGPDSPDEIAQLCAALAG
jgi:hypothetical protein